MSRVLRGLEQFSLWTEDGSTLKDFLATNRRSVAGRRLVTEHESVPTNRPTVQPSRLQSRLRALGLPHFDRITTHRNHTVMVSFQGTRILRIHEGYAQAPDEVLRAIARFVSPGTRRPARAEAKRILLGFQLDDENDVVTVRQPAAPKPEDQPILERLRRLHIELNHLHFGGQLQTIEIRLSNRMRRRLGEVRLDKRSGAPLEISLSRRHLRRDGWSDARQTLLHEMVHQWQAESALPVDHGAQFRRKAREVGIEPRAVRAGR